MTVRAPGTNSPLRRTTKAALARVKKLADKYIAEGMTPQKAEEKAYQDLRDNPRRDWRRKARRKAKK
jgi:hypothetical protein